jgi:hypothetical protein
MEKEYQFIATVEKCRGCGLKLSGKRVEVGGWKGSVPMGYCKCGTAYPLVEIESEPEPVEPAPEPTPPEPESEQEE